MARPLRLELHTDSESCGQRPAIDLMVVCILEIQRRGYE